MIVQSVLNWFAGIIASMVDAIPDVTPEVSAGIASIPAKMQTAIDYIDKLSPILPLDQLEFAVRFVLFGALLGLSIKITRMLISWATGGGGATS